jgi:acetyl esterase/lipase
VAVCLGLTGCRPAPEANALGYLVGSRWGAFDSPLAPQPASSLAGRVLAGGQPVAGATVVVAERTGAPHAARTDAAGRYRIDGLPPGQYVPAAVAAGYEESPLTGLLDIPALVTLAPGGMTAAPDLELRPQTPVPLPENLAAAVNLRTTHSYTATSPFPAGAATQVLAYAFDRAGQTVDTLRLYLPRNAAPGQRLPLLFLVYPSPVEDWEDVSVAFAASGFAAVAMSPSPGRGADVDAHAQDALVALTLARRGELSPAIGDNRPVAMGGSFSSAILARLLRLAPAELAGWVTVGGLANAFTAAADFYAGRIEMPPNYDLLVPALGQPNLYPEPFLRYSPVYSAAELPPTLIIHTAADRILPIAQAYELAAAVRAAGIPLETYYYEDVSHYLGIGDNMTDAGREMFYRILEFVKRYGTSAH